MIRASLLVALGCIVISGCGDGSEARAAPLAVGEVLDTDLALPAADDEDGPLEIASLLGRRATVFYAWSVPCPCVENAEFRIRRLMEKYPRVAWIAVDGEPGDTREAVQEKRLRMGSPYRILLDPEQALCRVLGFDAAVQVAVLDADRRLRYRGPMDDDFVNGNAEFLDAALEAVLGGGTLAAPEREPTYGCRFDDPASCTQLR